MQDLKRAAVSGHGIVVRGNDIDTDRIIPARFLKCITYDGLGEHVFADDRQQMRAAGMLHPFDMPEYSEAEILLVNKNFGCGSSREHAGQALKRWNKGIKAVIGESFAEIFFSNCLANGIPCISTSGQGIETLMQACEHDPRIVLQVDLENLTVRAGNEQVALSMPEGARKALIDGHWDATQELLSQLDEVKALATRLPYFHFRTHLDTQVK